MGGREEARTRTGAGTMRIITKQERSDTIRSLGGTHAVMAMEDTGTVYMNRFDANAGIARVGEWKAETVDRETGDEMQPVLTSFELRFVRWVADFTSGKAAKRSATKRNSNAWRRANRLGV